MSFHKKHDYIIELLFEKIDFEQVFLYNVKKRINFDKKDFLIFFILISFAFFALFNFFLLKNLMINCVCALIIEK